MIDDAAAAELYVYGYPLVYCVDEILKLSGGAGINELRAIRRLLGPETKFVSPNNDTCYLMAPLDVSGGPLLLHTPDAADRYYVLQFVDPWTNNFAYVGRRATGTAAGDWLLAPAGYDGDVPDGATVIEVPTDLAVIVGRIQVDSPDDLPAVHALQDQFSLTALPGNGELTGVPHPDPSVPDELAFWEKFRVSLQRFPPPPADAEFVELASAAGLLDATPLVDTDAPIARVLIAGKQQGKESVESIATRGRRSAPGSWTSALHMFDYNLDRLGVGTIDSPEWKIADRRTAYRTRAVSARAGLWGNHGYEADYEIVHQDEHGQPLHGSHRYEVTFDPPPPAHAFWSLTMYDTPDYYLVANPIDRYSIGDRTPGLQYGADGSVTIVMQTDRPDEALVSNWLPTPAEGFRPILRMYEPGDSVLDGTYEYPKIRRVG